MMNANSFMQSLLWTCTSCGFTYQGGQPKMECPICEAYKTSFIDTPQHVEAELRAEFGDDGSNTAQARDERLKKLKAGGYTRRFRLKGRHTEPVNENGPSRR